MLILVLLCALAASAQDAPKVNISQGVIEGTRVTYHEPSITHHGIQDGDYLSFYGIHYGAPTLGENRFKVVELLPIQALIFRRYTVFSVLTKKKQMFITIIVLKFYFMCTANPQLHT